MVLNTDTKTYSRSFSMCEFMWIQTNTQMDCVIQETTYSRKCVSEEKQKKKIKRHKQRIVIVHLYHLWAYIPVYLHKVKTLV